jgi:hypothetical protein
MLVLGGSFLDPLGSSVSSLLNLGFKFFCSGGLPPTMTTVLLASDATWANGLCFGVTEAESGASPGSGLISMFPVNSLNLARSRGCNNFRSHKFLIVSMGTSRGLQSEYRLFLENFKKDFIPLYCFKISEIN